VGSSVPLPALFLRADFGEYPDRFLLAEPIFGMSSGDRSALALPILQQIEIPHRDVVESEKSQEVWQTMLASVQARNIDEAEISRMFELRRELVEELFPLPPPADLAVPLRVLVEHLKFKGYVDDFDGNRSIDLGMQVNIPKQWQDPNSPEDAPRTKIPTDPKSLSAVAFLVGSTGYKIVRNTNH
jgi:hypothetical protein